MKDKNLPIGAEFEHNGQTLKVEERDYTGCNGCYFFDNHNGCLNMDYFCLVPERIFVLKTAKNDTQEKR